MESTFRKARYHCGNSEDLYTCRSLIAEFAVELSPPQRDADLAPDKMTTELSSTKVAGGTLRRVKHASAATSTDMTFAIFTRCRASRKRTRRSISWSRASASGASSSTSVPRRRPGLTLRPIGATVARQIPLMKVTRSNRVSVTGSSEGSRRRYTHRHGFHDKSSRRPA